MARTLLDWAAGAAPGVATVIDALMKASGFIQGATWGPANNDLLHRYRSYPSLPTPTIGDVAGSVTPSNVQPSINQVDLKLIQILQEFPYNLITSIVNGQVINQMEEEAMLYLMAVAQGIAKYGIYGTIDGFGDVAGFRGARQIAQANGKVIDAGGTTGSTTSLVAIRWQAGVTAMAFSPKAYAAGQLVQAVPLNGGQPVKNVNNTATNAGQIVVQMLYQIICALYSGTTDGVAAYYGLDASHTPTLANVKLMLDYAGRGKPGDMVLLCNRRGRSWLEALPTWKTETVTTVGLGGVSVDTRVSTIDGVPVLLEEAILDTETSTVDAAV